jgi:hypothetical protein
VLIDDVEQLEVRPSVVWSNWSSSAHT